MSLEHTHTSKKIGTSADFRVFVPKEKEPMVRMIIMNKKLETLIISDKWTPFLENRIGKYKFIIINIVNPQ